MNLKSIILIVAAAISGCATTTTDETESPQNERLTVGKVQKSISIGMSSAEVASTLGSPNIVTTDVKRREVWVYDRMNSTVVSNSNSAFIFLLAAGGNTSSSSKSRNQRTLTIMIKFDDKGLVRDYKYHSSSF